jgi:mannose-6-phosphate isomerase-like protein (cupin superfamily)
MIKKNVSKMKSVEDYISSGILEAYVLGLTEPHETLEVEQMASSNSEILQEINRITEDFEHHLRSNAVPPPSTVKPFVMASIDYFERLNQGELPSFPPTLHQGSQISDYAEWLDRGDMVLPQGFKNMHAKIIGYTPEIITGIVWIKDVSVEEVHDHEIEKFLIVEGTCEIEVEETVYKLVPGDYFSIPLHTFHTVKVSQDTLCKAVLQRLTA